MSDAKPTGNRLSGSTRIPVAEMAKDNLEKIFPSLTAEQAEALRTGKPVPPSPDWIGFSPENTKASSSPNPNLEGRVQELNQKVSTLEAANKQLERDNYRFDTLLAGMAKVRANAPLITAILVFADSKRLRRARKAVNQFVAQTYPNKQLVIVNASETPITNVAYREIREIKMEVSAEYPSASVGCMRNFALAATDGDAVFPHWDDDDVYDPHLLAYLAQAYVPGQAVLLSSQIRVDIQNSTAYVHTNVDGIPNTMLVPHDKFAKYPDKTGGEDAVFWSRYWSIKSKILDNAAWPFNSLLMRVHSGNNVLSPELFMLGHNGHEHRGKWELGVNEAEHMKAVLSTFGLKAEPKIPEETQPAMIG